MASNKLQMSDSDTLQLINEVKKHGCIWNSDDDNYSERHHLSMAWDEITKALDMPEDILRAKWKVCRDSFKREVKRKNINSVEEYQGRWRHFKDLGFLLRPGSGEEEEEQSDRVSVTTVRVKPERDEPKYAPDSNSNFEVYIEDPIPDKRRKTDDEDYNMMFLKSLKPFFDQLEPTRNLVVRSRMQDMLLNEIAAQNLNRNK